MPPLLKIRLLVCLGAMALAATAHAQDALTFADIEGWWGADPVHGGESSHLALRFVETEGKHEARLSIQAIGAYDINLGEVAIRARTIDTKGLSFPLQWDPATRTLSGHIPAEAAPIYRIPVEFRRGESPPKPPANQWIAPRPPMLWSVETGGAPIWAGIERDEDGTLYVGNENGVVNAIDESGKVRWKFETGKAIRSQPKAVGAHIYIVSDAGYLHKLNRKNGAELWRARVAVETPPRIPTREKGTRWDRYGSSIVTDGKLLFHASRDRNLYALDVKTGRERWRVPAGDIMTATPALHDDLVIYAAFDGKVSAVSKRDGSPRWTYDAKLAVAGDVVVSEGRVLVGSRTYDLIALEADTGKESWKRYYWFSWIESPPVVRDGLVYTGSSDATSVHAINLADGSLRWRTAVPGYSWQRTAVSYRWVIAGTVGSGAFPGSRAGALVALDRATGAIRWIHLQPPSDEIVKANKEWGFGASPVIAGDVVYAADLAGRVHAFSLR
jgi:outer membrane protein assembly factor BamB